MTGQLRYLIGDATVPIGIGNKLIAHVTNDAHGWGAGFVTAISRRWPEPERRYRELPCDLGCMHTVHVQPGLWVANMCAQRGFASRERPVALDYDALGKCLDQLAAEAKFLRATVHGPRFGSGLAGGRWETIESLITQRLIAEGIDVSIYDLPKDAS